MSILAANNITDAAGTGGPTLANGLTIGTSPLAAPSGSAPSYTCRAWVNFNGTGTVAIREDGNVSSVTDNGTGTYTLNFATAMPDANYALSGSAYNTGGNNSVGLDTNRAPSSSAAPITTSNTNTGAAFDSAITTVAVFR
jgi:hypothetical protein